MSNDDWGVWDNEQEEFEAYQEAKGALKAEWLEGKGMTYSDIMVDDEGREYVIEVIEMDEGENGDYTSKAVYIPEFTTEEQTAWLKANPKQPENLTLEVLEKITGITSDLLK